MPAANNFLVGADPEFAILGAGDELIIADLPNGKLGRDHGGRVVELRPDPSQLASRICVDIYRTLNRRELQPYRRYKWKAGGMAGGQAIGGHIHLDVPIAQLERFLPALDRMTEWFNTLELFPRTECEARRGSGYGSLGDVRAHGSRLEYRTPPSWLYSPNAAHLALTAFKLALVDPIRTLDTLQTPRIAPLTKFRNFIEGFKESDDDASSISPRLNARNGLEIFRGDPTVDLKVAWDLPHVDPAEVEAPVPVPSVSAAQAILQAQANASLDSITQAMNAYYPSAAREQLGQYIYFSR